MDSTFQFIKLLRFRSFKEYLMDQRYLRDTNAVENDAREEATRNLQTGKITIADVESLLNNYNMVGREKRKFVRVYAFLNFSRNSVCFHSRKPFDNCQDMIK